MSFLIAPRTLEAKQFSKNVPITVRSSKTHSAIFAIIASLWGNNGGELWIFLMNHALVERRRTPAASESNGAELSNCSVYVCERITRERANNECFREKVVTNCEVSGLAKRPS